MSGKSLDEDIVRIEQVWLLWTWFCMVFHHVVQDHGYACLLLLLLLLVLVVLVVLVLVVVVAVASAAAAAAAGGAAPAWAAAGGGAGAGDAGGGGGCGCWWSVADKAENLQHYSYCFWRTWHLKMLFDEWWNCLLVIQFVLQATKLPKQPSSASLPKTIFAIAKGTTRPGDYGWAVSFAFFSPTKPLPTPQPWASRLTLSQERDCKHLKNEGQTSSGGYHTATIASQSCVFLGQLLWNRMPLHDSSCHFAQISSLILCWSVVRKNGNQGGLYIYICKQW